MLHFRSLSPLLMTTMLIMTAVPIAVLIGFSYSDSQANVRAVTESASRARQALVTARGDALAGMAASCLDAIQRNLFERFGDVQAFSIHPAAKNLDAEHLTKVMDTYMVLYGIYDLMLVTNKQGVVIAMNSSDQNGKPTRAPNAFVGQTINEPFIDDVRSGRASLTATDYAPSVEPIERVRTVTGGNGLALRFTFPITDAAGAVIGAWTTYASWDRIVGTRGLLRKFEETYSNDNQKLEVTMLDEQGAVIYDGKKDGAYDKSLNLSKLKAVENYRAALRTLAKEEGTGAIRTGSTEEPHLRDNNHMNVNGWATTAGALGFKGYTWGMIVRQDSNQIAPAEAPEIAAAHAQADSLLALQAVVGAVLLGLALIAAYLLARSLVQPIRALEEVLAAVAKGDLTRKAEVAAKHEIGRLAASTNITIEQLRGLISRISQGSNTLSAASEELSATANQLVQSSQQATEQATAVSSAATQVNANVGVVASSSEQMAITIKEISQNTTKAAQVANEAAEHARRSDAMVQRLGQASAEVGSVVQTIAGIAEQTNLLALNATIEAARAGEAGRGFAVVANEVKELARQTASATDDIRTRITAIQTDITGTVEALKIIGSTIEQINAAQHTVATAVE